jgi:hypothetical protein
MDPTSLIGPESALGYPAPFWFVELFKVLGFSLHLVPMNLWYAGLVLGAFLYWLGGANARRFVTRLMKQMPIIVALGINFGIVPLLFTQVAYYRVFYPATILMAWFWFSILALLMVGYYGVYIYSTALRSHAPLSPLKRAVGWIAAICFAAIGFLFNNAFTLMTNLEAWPSLWRGANVGGAVLGIQLNLGDPSLLPRWLLMFGLALITLSAYTTIDAAFFAGRETEEYRTWAGRFALKVASAGVAWFGVASAWYVFGTWTWEPRQLMLGGPLILLTVATAVAPGLTWLMVAAQRNGATRALASVTGVVQFVVLALNAVSRQLVQNAELGRFLDVSAEPVDVQWSPLILFLVLFVLGLGVIAWMVGKVIEASRAPAGMGQ